MKVEDLGPARAAIVLGSGLSEVARTLTGARPVPYEELEGMPRTSVPGHQGALYAGEAAGVRALVFAGRVHLYEGFGPAEVCFAVRAACRAGCDTVVLTNACGAIAPELEIGKPCLIADHLNLTGRNPLRGPAFLDLTDLYDPGLRTAARAVEPSLREGVYAGLAGPTYETPAEVRMLAALGADMVGMSTVLEAIAARHCGARVLGISVPANRAAGLQEGPLDHAEVARRGREAAGRLEALLAGVLARL